MTHTTSQPTTKRAIIHINGESLFSSIEQAKYKKLEGKPLVVVSLQGTLLSVSVEAKKLGITLSMPLKELKKLFPTVTVIERSRVDYAAHQKKVVKILKRYTQDVEEYGGANYFADITGLRTLLKMTYKEIGDHMVKDFDRDLGISLPTCLSTSKVLAHFGSKLDGRHTLRVINEKNSIAYLKTFFVEDIWNISGDTIAYLNKLRIYSAYDLVKLPVATVEKVFQPPVIELWKELRGISVWHDLTLTDGDEIDFSAASTKFLKKDMKVTRSNNNNLGDAIEKLYDRMTNWNRKSVALQNFEDRLKRHLIVPYIGKVS